MLPDAELATERAAREAAEATARRASEALLLVEADAVDVLDLRVQLEELRAALARCDAAGDELRRQVAGLEADAVAVRTERDVLRAQRDEAVAALAARQAEEDDMRAYIGRLEAELAARPAVGGDAGGLAARARQAVSRRG